jgi:WD40 repeat protein
VKSLAFSNDDTLLASAGQHDEEIRLWELGRQKMKTKPTVLETQARTTLSVKFARDDKVLACACSNNGDNTIRIWDRTQPGKEPLVLRGHKECINSLSFGPDGWKLASGSDDPNVGLWNLDRPNEGPVWLRHGDKVHCVAIDPNGTTLASGGADGQVRIWDLTNLASDARVLPGPGGDVYAVAFSPDGRWLAAGGSNKTVVVWPRTKVLAEMVCQKVWRNLTEDEWSEFVGMGRYEWTCQWKNAEK